MKTYDDDYNMMSSTTKDDSSLMNLQMTSSRSQTTSEDKGRESRGRHKSIPWVCKIRDTR